MESESNELEVLSGIRLDAIVFVMDYLQIQFDGGVATYLQFPDVTVRDRTYSYGDQDYRNVLCEFILSIVASVDYEDDVSFCLNFEKGKICVSLAPDRYIYPEMVLIHLAGKTIVI